MRASSPESAMSSRVFGSSRTTVTRYDRRTRQTTQVGPDPTQRAGGFGRNVRTMPLHEPDGATKRDDVQWFE